MTDHRLPDPISDRGVQTKSRDLEGRHLALGISGGIGSVEVVKIIRELRRHGARVTPFLTEHAEAFITPLSVEWAAGEKAVRQPGAEVDHLDAFDLVVIAPATLNTIARSAVGIADNAVTLLVASQLGRKGRLLFVPTMNAQLRAHPAYAEHVARLEGWGARFLAGDLEEDRLKMPTPEMLATAVKEFFL